MRTWIWTVAFGLLGCDDGFDGGGGGAGYRVEGGVSGGGPAAGEVYVIWAVSSESPDYEYAHGHGAASGDGFTVGLSEPPAEALNSNGVGVGFVVLIADGESIPSGVVAYEDLDVTLLGGARDVVIFREEEVGPGFEWSGDFPPGFSCGTCAPSSGEDLFDSFAPIDCSEMVIEIGTDLGGDCNWT